MSNATNQIIPVQRVRLVLLTEHLLFREGLAQLLSSEPRFELIAECASAAVALEALKRSEVDLILLDLKLGEQRSDEFICTARWAGYAGKFLIVTPSLDPANSALALKLGASGVFLQSGSAARLIQAINLVVSGDVWVDPQIIQALADRYPAEGRPLGTGGLTGRQQTVLDGVATGLTNRTIAVKLGVSEGTVKATLQQLFDKAGVRTRSQLVRVALSVWNTSQSATNHSISPPAGQPL